MGNSGIRLSRCETLVVFSAGLIEAESRKHVTEVRNLARAITETEQAIARGDQLLKDEKMMGIIAALVAKAVWPRHRLAL
jgi:hypothetical protein